MVFTMYLTFSFLFLWSVRVLLQLVEDEINDDKRETAARFLPRLSRRAKIIVVAVPVAALIAAATYLVTGNEGSSALSRFPRLS